VNELLAGGSVAKFVWVDAKVAIFRIEIRVSPIAEVTEVAARHADVPINDSHDFEVCQSGHTEGYNGELAYGRRWVTRERTPLRKLKRSGRNFRPEAGSKSKAEGSDDVHHAGSEERHADF
jgi:hypothetical protein